MKKRGPTLIHNTRSGTLLGAFYSTTSTRTQHRQRGETDCLGAGIRTMMPFHRRSFSSQSTRIPTRSHPTFGTAEHNSKWIVSFAAVFFPLSLSLPRLWLVLVGDYHNMRYCPIYCSFTIFMGRQWMAGWRWLCWLLYAMGWMRVNGTGSGEDGSGRMEWRRQSRQIQWEIFSRRIDECIVCRPKLAMQSIK